MIVVSHEMGFAREVADRVLMMDDGHDHRGGHAGALLHATRNTSGRRRSCRRSSEGSPPSAGGLPGEARTTAGEAGDDGRGLQNAPEPEVASRRAAGVGRPRSTTMTMDPEPGAPGVNLANARGPSRERTHLPRLAPDRDRDRGPRLCDRISIALPIPDTAGISIWLGTAAIVAGVATCLAGLGRYRQTRRGIEDGDFQAAGGLIMIVAIACLHLRPDPGVVSPVHRVRIPVIERSSARG